MGNQAQKTKNHRVLIVSYLFPPCGESGVQRNLKYAKFLPLFDWQPYVLTVKDIVYHSYDYSLLDQLSPEVVVIRTGSMDPYRIAAILRRLVTSKNNRQKQNQSDQKGNTWLLRIYRNVRDWFFFPDTCFPWIPFAFLKGFSIIKRNRIEVIIASVWPFSTAIASYLLSKATGVPFILDFRDGWTDDPYLVRPTQLHKIAHRILEKLVVSRANFVCVYGDYLRDILAVRFPNVRSEVLTNGYDSDDFVGIKPAFKNQGIRRIVYSGSLYSYHGSFFRSLLDSLSGMPQNVLNEIEIIFLGRVEIPNAQDLISGSGLEHNVKLIGYVPHKTSIGYLLSADALLFALPAADVSSYSGKIFEYIMTKKPIISFVNEQGIAADLLRKIGCGDWIVPPGQENRFAEIITAISNLGWPELHNNDIEKFSRKDLTKRLAEILKSITL
jgi:hypothetical protein